MLNPMPTSPASVRNYLSSLPPDQRAAINTLRGVFRDNLDPAIKEEIQYGIVGYHVPHTVYPNGYHCDPSQPLPFAGLAARKNAISIYLFCIYADKQVREDFMAAWTATGRRLDMGKGCIRVRAIGDVPLDVLAKALRRMTLKRFIQAYEQAIPPNARRKARPPAVARPAVKKPVKGRSQTSAATTAARPSASPAPKRQARGRTPRAGRSAPRSQKER